MTFLLTCIYFVLDVFNFEPYVSHDWAIRSIKNWPIPVEHSTKILDAPRTIIEYLEVYNINSDTYFPYFFPIF